MDMGRERLRSLTNNLGSMLSQSTSNMVTAVKKTADNDTIRQYLASGNKIPDTAVQVVLKKLRTDSTVVLVQLFDSGAVPRAGYSEVNEDLQK